MKKCPSCKVLKPAAEYHRSAKNRDGLSCYCKPCHRIRDERPKNRFGTARAAMRAEGTYRDLTFEQWLPLIQMPCYYCGWPLSRTGRGVDRIRPEIGYTATNLVSCCGACNAMKGKFISCDEFKRHCGPAVAAIKAERKAKGLDTLTARTARNQHDRPTREQLRKTARLSQMLVSAPSPSPEDK